MKLIAGRRYVNVDMRTVATENGDRIFMKFKYNKTLLTEIKMMEGARWHPDTKMWSIKDTQRNRFQLEYLAGKNPYARYDAELIVPEIERKVYSVQRDMIAHVYTRRQCILAAEMGLGKTLTVIELMDAMSKEIGLAPWWFVAPKNTCIAIEMEFKKWGIKHRPILMTYENMSKRIKEWTPGTPAPFGVIFDEAHYLRNHKALRTQYAMHLTTSMREEHDDPFIILMTGTPQPKEPTSWWSLCEIACPGFLREGDPFKFKKTLAVVVERESITGGIYPHIVSWRSSDKICDTCGEDAKSAIHGELEIAMGTGHVFKPAVNEVARLYKRLNGLVMIKLKKGNLDLPEKIYRRIRLPVIRSIHNAAKMITRLHSGAKAQILLRELSDGFQYKEVETGNYVTCPGCGGTGIQIASEITGVMNDDDLGVVSEPSTVCSNCKGEKKVPEIHRTAVRVASPKSEALKELLEEHEQYRRLVVYCGFHDSVDRCCDVATESGWSVIKVDGRGLKSQYENPLEVFQSDCEDNICFIGHPGSGGTGLTLTKSPSIVYYSNSFNAVERWQSEDRIHRPGADHNRGCNIIDLFHLPTDELVLHNLERKKDLQSVSIGELNEYLERAEFGE